MNAAALHDVSSQHSRQQSFALKHGRSPPLVSFGKPTPFMSWHCVRGGGGGGGGGGVAWYTVSLAPRTRWTSVWEASGYRGRQWGLPTHAVGIGVTADENATGRVPFSTKWGRSRRPKSLDEPSA